MTVKRIPKKETHPRGGLSGVCENGAARTVDAAQLPTYPSTMAKKLTPRPWIDARLKDLGKSKAGLARALGVGPARINEIVSGERRIQLGEVDPLARFLEWPGQAVIERVAGKAEPGAEVVPLDVDLDYNPKLRDLPVYGAVDMGAGHFTISDEPVDFIDRSPALRGNKRAYGLYCTQDEMSPAYDRGDTFIVDPTKPVAPGSDALFIRTDGHRCVRRVLDITPTAYKVRQFNPPKNQTLPMSEWTTAQKIFGSRRR